MNVSASAAIAEISRRRLVSRNYVLKEPFARQKEFLALDCFEALYGGAAGSGKSEAILMAAAQYLHVPKYAALILRRTYKDLALEDAIMARAAQWWAQVPGVRWDKQEKRCEFPAGSSVTFGYLDTEQDKFRYQGSAFQFIGFDEATQFTESKYTYLTSRVRRNVDCDVPLRVRAASNPGGIGHDWVFRRFVDPKTAIAPFVPAKLDDNFHLDGASYRETLQRLDPTTRRQLLDGVWIRDGSGLVYEHFTPARNCIPLSALPKLDFYLGALDFGVNDQNALTIVGWREHDPCVYVRKSFRFTGIVADVAREVRAATEEFHPVKWVGDVGGMGKLFQAELASRYGINIAPASKTDKLGFIRLMNSELHEGHIKVADDGGSCHHLLEEWAELPWDDKRLKEAPGFNNHASDSALYDWREARAFHEVPKTPRAELDTFEAARRMAIELERRTDEQLERERQEEKENQW